MAGRTVHRFAFRVRYGDTDQMGMAYYANYLRWFEVGRVELLRSLGTTYQSIEREGVRLPVLEAACRYLRPARYDDLLAVETAVARLGRASVRFHYRIVREGESDPLALGHTEHCFMSPEGKPIRPPESVRAALALAPRA